MGNWGLTKDYKVKPLDKRTISLILKMWNLESRGLDNESDITDD